MSQYKFKINGKEFEVAVNSIENNIAYVNVNGVNYSVEINGGLDVVAHGTSGAPENLPIFGDKPRVARPAEAVSPAPASATSGKKIVSPLPGVIIDVCVNVGDAVKRGQKIAVIEAMKMENDILAEADGTVTAIYVKKTDSVLEGADIASIA